MGGSAGSRSRSVAFCARSADEVVDTRTKKKLKSKQHPGDLTAWPSMETFNGQEKKAESDGTANSNTTTGTALPVNRGPCNLTGARGWPAPLPSYYQGSTVDIKSIHLHSMRTLGTDKTHTRAHSRSLTHSLARSLTHTPSCASRRRRGGRGSNPAARRPGLAWMNGTAGVSGPASLAVLTNCSGRASWSRNQRRHPAAADSGFPGASLRAPLRALSALGPIRDLGRCVSVIVKLAAMGFDLQAV